MPKGFSNYDYLGSTINIKESNSSCSFDLLNIAFLGMHVSSMYYEKPYATQGLIRHTYVYFLTDIDDHMVS